VKIEILQAQGGKEWFWHFKNKGRIIAVSETFPSRSNALRAAKSCVRGVLKPMPTRVPLFKLAGFTLTWL
jgi:uncharacterized protein YegP (UPF0339 family)